MTPAGAGTGAGDVLRYDELQRLGRPGRWRGVVGIGLVFVGVFVLASYVALLPFVVFYAASGRDVGEAISRTVDLDAVTPGGLAWLFATLSAGIVVVWFVTRLLHSLALGWVSSVYGRLRWRYLVACLGVSLVVLVLTLIVGSMLPGVAEQAAEQGSVGLNEITTRTRAFLAVIVLMTPFQAAAEEYIFRGYLVQALGGLVAARTVSVGGSALLFALAHGSGQGWPVFIDRLAFGVMAGLLVLITGGLEAAIAMHVLNNVVALGIAVLVGDVQDALAPSGGSWWMVLSTLFRSAAYLLLAWWAARAMGLTNAVRAPVLARAEDPV